MKRLVLRPRWETRDVWQTKEAHRYLRAENARLTQELAETSNAVARLAAPLSTLVYVLSSRAEYAAPRPRGLSETERTLHADALEALWDTKHVRGRPASSNPGRYGPPPTASQRQAAKAADQVTAALDEAAGGER